MKKIYILLFVIFILALFLRTYKLGEVPIGLTNDEASLGYDAYSVLLTGRDQWKVFLPINFKEFGDYRLPAYIYLSLLPIKIFGLSEFSIRLLSALFGVFSIVILYFLVKKILDEKKALFASLLLAISPWSIGLSRVALEPNIAITFFLLSLLFIFYFLYNKKKKYFLYLSILFFSLTFYTYSAYTLFTPLVILIIIYFYRKIFLSMKKEILISFLLFIFLFLPLIINSKLTAGVRFSQVGIINNINSIGLINTLNDKRGACLKNYPSILCKATENKVILFTNNFLQNYFSHFSFNFLYIQGNPTQYSILPERRLGFIFEAFLLISGFVYLLIKRTKENILVLFLLLVSPIPDSLTGSGHYARASLMLPFLVIIEGVGLYYFLVLFSKIKILFLRYALYGLSSFIILFAVFSFFVNYITYYKNFYSIFSHFGYKTLMEVVYANRNNYDRIYISKHLNDTKQYIFYLFYNKYDPQKYQSKIDVSYSKDKNGWISIDRIDNIYFVQNLPSIPIYSELANENILFVSNPVDFAKNAKVKNLIKDKRSNVLFKVVELKEILRIQNLKSETIN